MRSSCFRFFYSEQATRNDVLRYYPSWQYSAAYCSCNKEAPEAFSMGSFWSPTIICPDLASCDFHLSSYETVVGRQLLAQWAADQRSELAESTGCWLLWRGHGSRLGCETNGLSRSTLQRALLVIILLTSIRGIKNFTKRNALGGVNCN